MSNKGETGKDSEPITVGDVKRFSICLARLIDNELVGLSADETKKAVTNFLTGIAERKAQFLCMRMC